MSLGRYRICSAPGCGAVVPKGQGKCDRCRRERYRELDARRLSPAERGYGSRWRRIQREFLAAYPWCETEGCDQPAKVADHHPVERVELVRQGVPDPDRWEYLVARCISCHNRKTAQTVGFGR
jgi:5-methylcytosine-specific restriction protein A